MNYSHPVLECVPNFSVGNDMDKINAIADAIRSVEGAKLLHIDISQAANRTVMTFAGEPEAVVEAAFRAIKKAAEVIDMRQQKGVHPRIGATDVCPLVPLYGMTMDEAVSYSKMLAERVGNELKIPVYLYEYSAIADYRRSLPAIRKGEYEGLEARMKLAEWVPDYGPKSFVAEKGATVIGARNILVAFNISIDTQEVEKAEWIARRMRESGYIRIEGDKKVRVPGLLPRLRAIGWYMADFGSAQVSMNLLDYRISSPLKVWETCHALANEIGVKLIGSELIGLIPDECLLEAGTYAYMKRRLPMPEDKQMLAMAGIEYLGLDKVKPFNLGEKVLEIALEHAGIIN